MGLITWALELLRGIKPWLTGLADSDPTLFYVAVVAIIFAETGLVLTPFLPGDSLLFLVGAIAAASGVLSLPLLLVLLIAAAVLGDAVNYAVGAWLGPAVFRYERS